MNLEWIFFKTPSRVQKSFSKASPYFFCKDRAGFDGDRFNAVRLFRVISEDLAERDSLDESSAFLIEGAQHVLQLRTPGYDETIDLSLVGLRWREEVCFDRRK